MQELSQESFHKVRHFFDESIPNLPVPLAVIEKHNPGKIWVNSLTNPSICLLVTPPGYSFLKNSIEIDAQSMQDIIAILKTYKLIKLARKKNEFPLTPFLNAGFSPLERIQFTYPNLMHGNTKLIDEICATRQADCEVKAIDASLIKELQWSDVIKLFYGDVENFLRVGFGVALLKNNQLISEAFACYIGGTFVETGSVTKEEYRRQGYATIIRAYLIKECLARNLEPISSCDAINVGSARASIKLGFQENFRYQFLIYKQN